jgi:hypothetical protein
MISPITVSWSVPTRYSACCRWSHQQHQQGTAGNSHWPSPGARCGLLALQVNHAPGPQVLMTVAGLVAVGDRPDSGW